MSLLVLSADGLIMDDLLLPLALLGPGMLEILLVVGSVLEHNRLASL